MSMEPRVRREQGLKFSKVIVATVLLLNVAFTATVLWVFLRTGAEPGALVAAWFSFTTIELWALSGIERAKIKNGGEYE